MNTSITKTSELEEICQIVRTTLDFYKNTFRPVGFEFRGKFDINDHSIDLKYYSATPYCIEMG